MAGAVLVAAVLAGCETAATTRLHVTDVDTARIDVAVVFEGEAALAASEPELSGQLASVWESNLGTLPQVDISDGRLALTQTVSVDQLESVSDLLGVSQVQLSPAADGQTTTLSAVLVRPSRLRTTITDAVSDEPDADALDAALSGSVIVETVVSFDGGVVQAVVDEQIPAEVTADTVRISQPLSEFNEGSVQVTGDPSGTPAWLYIAGGAAAAAAVALLARRRLRRSDLAGEDRHHDLSEHPDVRQYGGGWQQPPARPDGSSGPSDQADPPSPWSASPWS